VLIAGGLLHFLREHGEQAAGAGRTDPGAGREDEVPEEVGAD
jgi:hypothetical protein